MKKSLLAVLGLFVSVAAFAAPFDADLDLSSYEDVLSGSYDIDKILSSYIVGSNTAGIYQVNDGLIDSGSTAEIQQIGGEDNRAMIWQSAYNSSAQIIQTDGSNNVARLVQTGSGHQATLIQTDGSDNVMTVQMLGQNARIEATQVDAISNVLSVILNSGSYLKITQTGEGNSFSANLAPNVAITVTQTGQ
jgi:hypothetical protein